jgi:DNA-binding Lrp family transcriptional regulator
VIGAALGVSDHTIARRYRRLRSQGVLRVVGLPDSPRLGRTDWFLRLRCVPDSGRRLDRLIASGALFFDVEIAPEHLGYQVEALLWVTVAPGRLEEVAGATARHPHVALAAATSGATNLLLGVGCHDGADLYDCIAHHLGPIDGVQAVQTAPVIRTVKRAGSLLEAALDH